MEQRSDEWFEARRGRITASKIDFRVKRWECNVNGHAPVYIFAASRGKAFAECWRRYTSAYDCTFKRFIQIARVGRASEHHLPHFGDPITVGGEPAFYVGYAGGNSIHFARPGSDDVSLTHELDAVLPWETTETTDANLSERRCLAQKGQNITDKTKRKALFQGVVHGNRE